MSHADERLSGTHPSAAKPNKTHIVLTPDRLKRAEQAAGRKLSRERLRQIDRALNMAEFLLKQPDEERFGWLVSAPKGKFSWRTFWTESVHKPSVLSALDRMPSDADKIAAAQGVCEMAAQHKVTTKAAVSRVNLYLAQVEGREVDTVGAERLYESLKGALTDHWATHPGLTDGDALAVLQALANVIMEPQPAPSTEPGHAEQPAPQTPDLPEPEAPTEPVGNGYAQRQRQSKPVTVVSKRRRYREMHQNMRALSTEQKQ